MGLFSGVFEKRAPNTAYFGPPQEIWLGQTDSDTGESVSVGSALQLSAVYACVRVLAETVASLPLHVYKRAQSGRREKTIDRDHYLYRLLHDRPSPEWTAMMWRETLMASLACYGNAYAMIYRDGRRRPQKLQPWHPKAVRRENGRYQVKAKGGVWRDVPKGDMLHVRGLTIDPGAYYGVSPIEYARRSIGMGLATDKYGAKFFANSALPRGVISHPDNLSDEDRADLKQAWNKVYQGTDNAHNVALLEGGITFEPLSVPNDDAQWIESRKFSVTDIARVFHVPPHMIGDLERATFSNVEQQAIDFVVHTIRPWLVRIEQEINTTLFDEGERGEYFAEFVVDGLLRGDTQARFQAYAQAINWGWMSPNDVRDLENLNPVDGGDQYMVPLNMVPMSTLGGVPQPAPQNDGDQDTRASEQRSVEKRAAGAAMRRKVRNSYKRVIRQAADRLVRAELREIRRALDQNREARDMLTFKIWLERYYGNEFQAFAREQAQPVFQGLAQATVAATEEETGASADEAKLAKFVDDYTIGFASRHANSSRGQLQSLETFEEIDERLADWEVRRPGKIERNEAVRAADAVAVFAFASAGVTQLIWSANAGACPLCSEIDGTVVGIEQNFVGPGDTVDPNDGETTPLVSSGAMGHAPLHEGCDCTVVPG